MFPLLPKGDQTKLLKFFWLKIFFHLPLVSLSKPWAANISANFRKKFETVLMEYSGAGGNWFMKRTRSKKSRDTVPLNIQLQDCLLTNTGTNLCNFMTQDPDTQIQCCETVTIIYGSGSDFWKLWLRFRFRILKIYGSGLCRWFRFAQLAKGKKSRP